MTLNSSPYFGKPEVLGDRGVEDAHRVRELDPVLDLHLVAAAHAPHGADEVAEAVDREQRRLVEWRHEEAARHVRLMVLDAVHCRRQRGPADAERVGERRLRVAQHARRWRADRGSAKSAVPCDSANISLR